MNSRWVIKPRSSECEQAARRWQMPNLVAQLLLNRGLKPGDSPASFLSPQLTDLHAPSDLFGATEAASAIVQAVEAGDKIVIYGDYDVDGTTSIAILWHMLTEAGASVTYYVPHRLNEGYGLNMEAIERLVKEGARLIVSVDCGITAVDEARYIKQAGAKLIVTDHHVVGEQLPDALAIVHPLLGHYPNRNLCGAGVAFKLAWAIAQALSRSEKVTPPYRTLLMNLLPLAALGTIADVVSLTGENRIIAKRGLLALSKTQLAGLRALMESAGLVGNAVSDFDVGFKIAPRINAAGRMGHARLAVELLTRADEQRAREIALYLEDHNNARRTVERKILKQACEIIDRDDLARDAYRAIVLASEDWHAGVIGIVASRLVDKYKRPAILIALGDKEGQGSARSIEPLHLTKALALCSDHLLSYGGHAMAAGLRIASDGIDGFCDAFRGVVGEQLTGADLQPKLSLDAEVTLEEMTLPLVEVMATLGPFGADNAKPKFATDWVELAAEPRSVGKKSDHLQAKFRQHGVEMKAIGFGLATHIEDLKERRRCRIAFEPIINDFRGNRSVEMQMVDLAFETT